jgi:hypothetical protein
MSGVATAIVGGAVVGAYATSQASKAQSSAANRATDVAAQTAADQAAVQREMFERQVELQEPFRKAGLEGQNRLLQLLGLAVKPTEPGADASQAEKDQYAKDLASYNQLRGASDFGKYASAEFGLDKFKADPGYAFRMSEGMKALERSAASRGGLLSGATLKATQRYGQDLASQEFTNAFNRYQAERTGTLNPYQSLAGTAQSSSNMLGQQAGQYGANVSNILGSYGSAAQANAIGAGNAQASGYIGLGNVVSGGIGQGINFYQNQQLMNRLFPSSGGSSWGQTSTGLYSMDG